MARHKQVDNETLIRKLTQVFRDYGYEGASLTNLSKATGLKKSKSLPQVSRWKRRNGS